MPRARNRISPNPRTLGPIPGWAKKEIHNPNNHKNVVAIIINFFLRPSNFQKRRVFLLHSFEFEPSFFIAWLDCFDVFEYFGVKVGLCFVCFLTGIQPANRASAGFGLACRRKS